MALSSELVRVRMSPLPNTDAVSLSRYTHQAAQLCIPPPSSLEFARLKPHQVEPIAVSIECLSLRREDYSSDIHQLNAMWASKFRLYSPLRTGVEHYNLVVHGRARAERPLGLAQIFGEMHNPLLPVLHLAKAIRSSDEKSAMVCYIFCVVLMFYLSVNERWLVYDPVKWKQPFQESFPPYLFMLYFTHDFNLDSLADLQSRALSAHGHRADSDLVALARRTTYSNLVYHVMCLIRQEHPQFFGENIDIYNTCHNALQKNHELFCCCRHMVAMNISNLEQQYVLWLQTLFPGQADRNRLLGPKDIKQRFPHSVVCTRKFTASAKFSTYHFPRLFTHLWFTPEHPWMYLSEPYKGEQGYEPLLLLPHISTMMFYLLFTMPDSDKIRLFAGGNKVFEDLFWQAEVSRKKNRAKAAEEEEDEEEEEQEEEKEKCKPNNKRKRRPPIKAPIVGGFLNSVKQKQLEPRKLGRNAKVQRLSHHGCLSPELQKALENLLEMVKSKDFGTPHTPGIEYLDPLRLRYCCLEVEDGLYYNPPWNTLHPDSPIDESSLLYLTPLRLQALLSRGRLFTVSIIAPDDPDVPVPLSQDHTRYRLQCVVRPSPQQVRQHRMVYICRHEELGDIYAACPPAPWRGNGWVSWPQLNSYEKSLIASLMNHRIPASNSAAVFEALSCFCVTEEDALFSTAKFCELDTSDPVRFLEHLWESHAKNQAAHEQKLQTAIENYPGDLCQVIQGLTSQWDRCTAFRPSDRVLGKALFEGAVSDSFLSVCSLCVEYLPPELEREELEEKAEEEAEAGSSSSFSIPAVVMDYLRKCLSRERDPAPLNEQEATQLWFSVRLSSQTHPVLRNHTSLRSLAEALVSVSNVVLLWPVQREIAHRCPGMAIKLPGRREWHEGKVTPLPDSFTRAVRDAKFMLIKQLRKPCVRQSLMQGQGDRLDPDDLRATLLFLPKDVPNDPVTQKVHQLIELHDHKEIPRWVQTYPKHPQRAEALRLVFTALAGCHMIYPHLLQQMHTVLLDDPEGRNDTVALLGRVLQRAAQESVDFERRIRHSFELHSGDPFFKLLQFILKDTSSSSSSSSSSAHSGNKR